MIANVKINNHPSHTGDWLEKLNGSQVTHRDLDDTLRSITSTEIVRRYLNLFESKKKKTFTKGSYTTSIFLSCFPSIIDEIITVD